MGFLWKRPSRVVRLQPESRECSTGEKSSWRVPARVPRIPVSRGGPAPPTRPHDARPHRATPPAGLRGAHPRRPRAGTHLGLRPRGQRHRLPVPDARRHPQPGKGCQSTKIIINRTGVCGIRFFYILLICACTLRRLWIPLFLHPFRIVQFCFSFRFWILGFGSPVRVKVKCRLKSVRIFPGVFSSYRSRECPVFRFCLCFSRI